MIVRVTFTAEDGDGEEIRMLHNHSIHIDGVDRIKVNTPIDMGYDTERSAQTGVQQRFTLGSGGIELSVHGKRPTWVMGP